jgi:hypothetical protein
VAVADVELIDRTSRTLDARRPDVRRQPIDADSRASTLV